MNQNKNLLAIKTIHTLIWLFFVVVIFYILYSGIFNRITIYTWIGIGLIIAEGIVLLIFKMFCPLTLLARKYSDSKQDNFDIFLPNWLAKNNKLIFTTIFLIGLIMVIIHTIQKWSYRVNKDSWQTFIHTHLRFYNIQNKWNRCYKSSR